jgi:hypothetical protein
MRRQLAPRHQFSAPLAAPAEANIIDLLAIADPATAWPRWMKHARKATAVLIGDDPGGPDGQGGPDAWQCLDKLSRWARAVIVHAAGGEPEHYAEAVRATLKVGRVAMIETTSTHAQAWSARMNCPRTLLILPRGGAHPVESDAEVVQ